METQFRADQLPIMEGAPWRAHDADPRLADDESRREDARAGADETGISAASSRWNPAERYSPLARRSSATEAMHPASLVGGLVAEAFNALDSDREVARNALHRVLALLEAEREQVNAGARSTERCELAPWQVRRVATHIERNLRTNIRLEDLAREARLSKSYLSRAFKGSFGRAPHRYILARRIERAQHEMLTTTTALCQIALNCGFADQAHFSRVFRRSVGNLPKEWRRARFSGVAAAGRIAISIAHHTADQLAGPACLPRSLP